MGDSCRRPDFGEAEEERLVLGGVVTSDRATRVQLTLGEAVWEAPVWFCDPWPLGFHLLGQEGFFRWFEVRLPAATYEIEITLER